MKTQIDVSWQDAAEKWKAYAEELEERIEKKDARTKELEVELAECREDCQRFADELTQRDNY